MKTETKAGEPARGREAPPRRSLHPLRFCFRFNLRRNLRFFLFSRVRNLPKDFPTSWRSVRGGGECTEVFGQ